MIIEGAQVDFGLIDQTISKDNVTVKATQSKYSNALSTVKNDKPRAKIAYLEKDYFLLDGSFVFPEDDIDYNIGYESENISNEQGKFLIEPSIEYKFDNTHESYGVQIFFLDDCIAKDFTIYYYFNDELIGEKIVTNNKDKRYSDFDSNLGWNKVIIIFHKINELQRARFTDVVFGITDHYTEDQLVEISASKKTDIVGDYSDCGEFSFTFFNDNRFAISDIKDLSKGLIEWLKCTVYVKYKGRDNYEPFCSYFSETTDVKDKGKLIQISGFDQLYMLSETNYLKGIVHTGGYSLADFARDVAEDAGIEIIIDKEFEDIISYGYISEVPHREALRLIAEAGNGILLCNSQGIIQLKKLDITSKNDLTDDEIVKDSFNINNNDKLLGVNVTSYEYVPSRTVNFTAVDTVKLTGAVQKRVIDIPTGTSIDDAIVYIREVVGGGEIPKDAGIKNIEIVTLDEETQIIDYEIYGGNGENVIVGVRGHKHTLQELGHIEEVLVTGQAQTLEIVYSIYPALTNSIKIYVNTSTSTIIDNVKVYADRVVFDILTSDGTDTTSFVTVVGTPYNTATYNTELGSNVKNVKKIESNYLISQNLVNDVADYQYNKAIGKYIYNSKIVSDKEINIKDKYIMQDNNVIITGINFSLSYNENSFEINGVDE